MILFYQERNHDYLAIDTGTNSYYLTNFLKDHYECPAAFLKMNFRKKSHIPCLADNCLKCLNHNENNYAEHSFESKEYELPH